LRSRDSFKLHRPNEIGHLWVVVSEPDADRSVVMVNFTTHRPGADGSCVITPADHPFIAVQSVVAYVHARIVPVEAQQRMLADPTTCIPRERISKGCLKRIQEGALVSKMTPGKIRTILDAELRARAAKP
jgi:hypothetical protein